MNETWKIIPSERNKNVKDNPKKFYLFMKYKLLNKQTEEKLQN